MMTLYHYTSEKGKKKIRREKRIRQSEGNVLFGDGTYVTKMPPTQGKKQVARNNYDGLRGWEQRENAGSVDYAFKLTIPAERVTRLTVQSGGRSIYKVDGDIDLREYDWELLEVDDKPC